MTAVLSKAKDGVALAAPQIGYRFVFLLCIKFTLIQK